MECKYAARYLRDEQTRGRPEYQQESSSDSEQDERMPELFTKERRQRRYKNQATTSVERKFYLMLDIEEFVPETLKAEVDTLNHTLVITGRRIFNPRQLEQLKDKKVKRVIPLPDNIVLEKLRVQVTPLGELVLKAPYRYRENGITSLQYRPCGFTTIPVEVMDFAARKRQFRKIREFRHFQQIQKPQREITDKDEFFFREYVRPFQPTWFYNTMPARERQFQKFEQFKHFQKMQKPRRELTDRYECFFQEYVRPFEDTCFYNSMEPRCVRDETTGKWQVVFEIYTVGFRPEEVKINFEEEGRLLIVKAKHEVPSAYETEELTNTYLRREFILPEWLDVKQMTYRIRNNGVLRIKLPCLRDYCPTHIGTQQQEKYQTAKRV